MSVNTGNILVVEDDPEINRLLGAYVKMHGYGYRGAMNGAAGIREARAWHPSLIVLDLMLPDTDGYEVCRTLKSDSDTASIPIVMVTALSSEENRRKGLECGAVAYMNKPFNPDALMALIKKNATAPMN